MKKDFSKTRKQALQFCKNFIYLVFTKSIYFYWKTRHRLMKKLLMYFSQYKFHNSQEDKKREKI